MVGVKKRNIRAPHNFSCYDCQVLHVLVNCLNIIAISKLINKYNYIHDDETNVDGDECKESALLVLGIVNEDGRHRISTGSDLCLLSSISLDVPVKYSKNVLFAIKLNVVTGMGTRDCKHQLNQLGSRYTIRPYLLQEF